MTEERLGRPAHGCIVVEPCLEGVREDLAVRVWQVAETVESSRSRFHHDTRSAHGRGGQHGAIEDGDVRTRLVWSAKRHLGEVQRNRCVEQVLETGADTNPAT